MRRRSALLWFVLVMMMFALASGGCGGGGGDGYTSGYAPDNPVTPTPETPDSPVTPALAVTPSALTLQAGGSGTLTASGYSGELEWLSEDDFIATVVSTGVATARVTAVAAGTTAILVIDDSGAEATVPVTVTSGETPANPTPDPTPTPIVPVIFKPGDDIAVVSQIIGAAGGTIEAKNTGTPIDGVSVTFPTGALMSDTEVSLGYNTGTLTSNYGIYEGINILLMVENVREFIKPIEITIPFKNSDSIIPVPYYIDDSGKLNPLQLIKIDRGAELFSFETLHASIFTWVDALMNGERYPYDTGFSPERDGFSIHNKSSSSSLASRSGNCSGMSFFSLWYYLNKKETMGSFSQLGFSDDIQQTIATQSQITIGLYNNALLKMGSLPDIILSPGEFDLYALIEIIMHMLSSRGPVVLGLSTGVFDQALGRESYDHAVLAYAIDRTDDGYSISIYDSNAPGDSNRKIFYNNLGVLTPYTVTYSNNIVVDYRLITYIGDGSWSFLDSFEAILNEAILKQGDETDGGNWIDVADTDWYTKDPNAANFEIWDEDDLAGLAKLVNDGTDRFLNKTITLARNIDLAGKEWTPIGGKKDLGSGSFLFFSFGGSFNGGGHTIDNLTININEGLSNDTYGLFGSFSHYSGCYIMNVNLTNLSVSISSSSLGYMIMSP